MTQRTDQVEDPALDLSDHLLEVEDPGAGEHWAVFQRGLVKLDKVELSNVPAVADLADTFANGRSFFVAATSNDVLNVNSDCDGEDDTEV